ncbi:MAG: hypothetical protein ACKOXK_03665 [Chakrabartia sp.]
MRIGAGPPWAGLATACLNAPSTGRAYSTAMIDTLSLLLAHGLLILMFWRLAGRDDLDRDAPADAPSRPFWPPRHDP